jgi:hypothetical protein
MKRIALLFCTLVSSLFAWVKNGTVFSTQGAQLDVMAAIAKAVPGDTVKLPAGTFVWGTRQTSVYIPPGVTLAGAGPAKTTIRIAMDAPQWGSGTITLSGAAMVRDLAVTQRGGGATTAFSANGKNGWRITNVVYNSSPSAGYFVYAGSYGLIDNCVINGGSGSDEWIFTRGPADSWQTPNSFGTADAVYVEDCTFNVAGYTDFNSNARGVVRFCTITGPIKIDAHGLASNTPARGVRQMEVYGNHWTGAGGYWEAFDLRGGTGMVFDNTCDNGVGAVAPFQNPRLLLEEYGTGALWPNFGNVFQTPANYPIPDQIGVGQDPRVAGSAPYYLWNNVQAGASWQIIWPPVADGALALYRTQTGNPAARFTMQDIVAADRDYFIQGASFDGSGGVGRGTFAQMNAITPTKKGVGFWVTDQGSWKASAPGTSGQFYVWSGSAWVLTYTPYTYPHPLRGKSP